MWAATRGLAGAWRRPPGPGARPTAPAGLGACKSGRATHLGGCEGGSLAVEEGKVRADKQNGSPAPHKRQDCSVSLCSRERRPLLGPIKKCPQYSDIVDSFKPPEAP